MRFCPHHGRISTTCSSQGTVLAVGSLPNPCALIVAASLWHAVSGHGEILRLASSHASEPNSLPDQRYLPSSSVGPNLKGLGGIVSPPVLLRRHVGRGAEDRGPLPLRLNDRRALRLRAVNRVGGFWPRSTPASRYRQRRTRRRRETRAGPGAAEADACSKRMEVSRRKSMDTLRRLRSRRRTRSSPRLPCPLPHSAVGSFPTLSPAALPA